MSANTLSDHTADSLVVADTATIPVDSLYPVKDSSEVKLQATIEMKKGYLSGICILSHQGDSIRGALFNEFGITAMDFNYDLRKDEVMLTTVMAMLDKWYVRPVLRKDLLEVLHALRAGKTTYKDDKYGIQFTFLPLKDNDPEDETEEQPF